MLDRPVCSSAGNSYSHYFLKTDIYDCHYFDEYLPWTCTADAIENHLKKARTFHGKLDIPYVNSEFGVYFKSNGWAPWKNNKSRYSLNKNNYLDVLHKFAKDSTNKYKVKYMGLKNAINLGIPRGNYKALYAKRIIERSSKK